MKNLTKTVLHVGCGAPNPKKLHATFHEPNWREIRLDIDPQVSPEVVADMRDLSNVPSQSVDAVWSSHNLEHLYPHEVLPTLKEWRRVLNSSGFALITLPDLQSIARFVADDKLEDAIYESPSGPITPLDILYGYRPSLANGHLFMAHKTGFTAKTLAQYLINAGFAMVSLRREMAGLNLWAVAFASKLDESEHQAAIAKIFPPSKNNSN